jgi:hypothetical protein
LALLFVDSTTAAIKIPFFQKKTYTPLVFFKVPKGISEECDKMESIVRDVERELDVRVERLDVTRDPTAEATLTLITAQHGPPFLYHRESLQIIYGKDAFADATSRRNKQKKQEEPLFDKARVKAWAKGRYLPSPRSKMMSSTGSAPVIVPKEDNAMDQSELQEAMKDASLSAMQLKGKEAMKERTAQKQKAK